jgi:hypothetical protein
LSLDDIVQGRYEGETENGTRSAEQALWMARIRNWYRNKTLDYAP